MTDLTSKNSKDISSGRPRDVPAENTKIPQGGATGAGIGAALGGALGVFAALTGLVVPGIGALLVAGPLFGAFTGAAAGGERWACSSGLAFRKMRRSCTRSD